MELPLMQHMARALEQASGFTRSTCFGMDNAGPSVFVRLQPQDTTEPYSIALRDLTHLRSIPSLIDSIALSDLTHLPGSFPRSIPSLIGGHLAWRDGENHRQPTRAKIVAAALDPDGLLLTLDRPVIVSDDEAMCIIWPEC